ncbi:MAG: peptidoglycan-binding protein [Clostridiales bacterium]|nr:peptidoglycan-binding protein [Clostridiales bacterium]
MKTMMRSGKTIRRGVSLLLTVSLLIALLPTIAAAETTPGAYGIVTVTAKNVVIRVTPGGTRTGYFAQPGDYPMIGPSIEVGGVTWYNLQTDRTSGYVHGDYAHCDYGGAGMPPTDKTYVKLLAGTTLYKGNDAEHPEETGGVRDEYPAFAGEILQLDGSSYSATYNSSTDDYINLYWHNDVYHTLYTAGFATGILTTDNLNANIANVTWQESTACLFRDNTFEGDYLTHALQAALSLLEYYDDDVDGFYGSNTEAAVQEFRGDNGLPASDDANEDVFEKAFEQATDRLDYIRSNPGLGGDTGGSGTTPANTITTTVDKLRIRKSYSTSSAYLGMIPNKGTVLDYTATHLNGAVTWYYIKYNGTYGWVMGTYVEESSSSGGSSTEITDYGTVTITKKLVTIRTSPNGSRSGYHVNTGDVCTMIGPSAEAGGYTWYHIRSEYGREGYVRGDCADADFGSAGMPDTEKKYVLLKNGMSIIAGHPSAPGATVNITSDTVLQLKTGNSYTYSSTAYIDLYYDNGTEYHTLYNADLIEGKMTTDDLNKYIINTIWPQGLPTGEQAGENLTDEHRANDIYVHAIQAALFELGLYTDKVDGIYGSNTADAVHAYKTIYGITPINYVIDDADSIDLFDAGMTALEAKRTGGGSGGVEDVGDFGTFSTVKKGSWAEVDGGSRSLFPKGTVATVMSAKPPYQVFRVYRWSGSRHADVVTYNTTDTAVLCAILGFTYSSATPSSGDLTNIKNSGDQDWPDYTWPKFRWGGTTHIGDYKIPVWVNLNGTVYCASIYVIPHGYNGTSSFSKSKRDGDYYYNWNNMYGMMCLHFYGSTTHGTGVVDPTHASNINYAYNHRSEIPD